GFSGVWPVPCHTPMFAATAGSADQTRGAMIRQLIGALLLAATAATAQSPVTSANTFDEARPPGENFDKADFRLWIPEGAGALRATVVLVPGSNGDGRPMVADTVWQSFANRNH